MQTEQKTHNRTNMHMLTMCIEMIIVEKSNVMLSCDVVLSLNFSLNVNICKETGFYISSYTQTSITLKIRMRQCIDA